MIYMYSVRKNTKKRTSHLNWTLDLLLQNAKFHCCQTFYLYGTFSRVIHLNVLFIVYHPRPIFGNYVDLHKYKLKSISMMLYESPLQKTSDQPHCIPDKQCLVLFKQICTFFPIPGFTKAEHVNSGQTKDLLLILHSDERHFDKRKYSIDCANQNSVHTLRN